MSKDLKIVKEFIDLAKSENVTELTYETDSVKLSVSLGAANVVAAPVVQNVVPQSSPKQAADAVSQVSNEDFYEVKSPFVGTFYLSPAPGKPAYVNVGDRISKGQTLCILEAMKIMNEIDSEVDGEVVEICVENESLVEFGEVLFKVRK